MKASKPNHQQVARAGEHFVAAELNRRGTYAVTFAGNMPRIDILASNKEQSRTIKIQVKTKRVGSWQPKTTEGRKCREPKEVDSFWVFVDLSKAKGAPEYYIVPEYWIRNDIYKAHQAYLEKYGGQRKHGGESTHHSVNVKRIEKWKDRWDVLRIF